MKFSENWLRELVNPPLDSSDLAHVLTMAGHEVDDVAAAGDGLDSIVVAEVLSVSKHPDADRLSVCQVSTGSGDPVEVVCGAPNVVAGMKSPLASPGTRLPDGTKLRRSKIRGVVSNGMLCSAIELGLGDESDGIIHLPDEAPTGSRLTDYLQLPDNVIDLDLTPNRGDCFSLLGVARDLSAMTDVPLSPPNVTSPAATIDDKHPVDLVVPKACPRFAGRVVRGIDSSAVTPTWMVERLRRSGIRAIHPVVDITNYVMMELGQPLHAYDLELLRGPIRPRFAVDGETATLLDGREVELQSDTLVIADDTGPIGLAGIMGGLSTAVSPATKDVFFEAAFWPPDVIAGRARHYALHTDASMRFERGVDPCGQVRAVERASELLIAIAGGDAGPVSDYLHEDLLPARDTVELRKSRLEKILGAQISTDRVTRILQQLQLDVQQNENGWSVVPPGFRFDISIEEDLIEEVARVYGYDSIPESTATAALPLVEYTETRVRLERVADALVSRDYQEVVTYSFVDEESNTRLSGDQSSLVLSNPISTEMSVMRSSLWVGMLYSASANIARQQERVRIFEIGKTFHGTLESPEEVVRIAAVVTGAVLPEQWGSKSQLVDFFDIKSDLETILELTGEKNTFSFDAAEHVALQPGQSANVLRNSEIVGVVGKLHPSVAKHFDIKKDIFVFELNAEKVLTCNISAAANISKFPSIRRDISILVNDNVSAAAIRIKVAQAAPTLIQDVIIFDVYTGPGVEAGLKSIALGLILQETSRTLTDEDADSARDAAVRKLEQEFAAVIRE
ncbi:MAG: phenylalanine--tRNA ligase subunit beta [Gammaproteobacteria bacterium]|nr:phenylalanine--tRNA ligase subunit beta [Gammaproteobacteria bacterium]